MNCWHCNNELIWGGDHDMEDEEDYDKKPKGFIENAKKEQKELDESYQQSKRNKKDRTTSEKLQEELEPIPPCPMSDE